MFTATTQLVPPAAALAPYIRHFAIRRFDTGASNFCKAMIADHEITMVFFLRSKLAAFKPFNGQEPAYRLPYDGRPDCSYAGQLTSTAGTLVFHGATTLLNIHFTPSGLLGLFGISPKELVDKLGHNADIFSKEINVLHERMQLPASIYESIQMLEQFLLKKIPRHKKRYLHPGIDHSAAMLMEHQGRYSVSQLAHECNMTLQTFKVRFIDQAGLPPKYFSRLVRFQSALHLKKYQPEKKWTEIAHATGYYDQVHFNKEFRGFTQMSPNDFMKIMPPPLEVLE